MSRYQSHKGSQPSIGRTSLKQKWWLVLLACFGVWGFIHMYSHGVSAQTQMQRYVVQQGDTVWTIALQKAPNADPRKIVSQIEQMNHLAPADVIKPGETLLIPSAN